MPPPRYGGIEWIVSLLADGLVDAGHDVTLFASGDSRTRATLAAVFGGAPTEHIGQTYWDLRHALSCLVRADEFDIVNDHSGALALGLGGLVSTPFVHTAHGPLSGEPGVVYDELLSLHPHARLISLSLSQRAPRPGLPWVANCPNALDIASYPVGRAGGDYLLFLGRMTADKGCHHAIEVALALGLPLKIAGKRREPLELEYFAEFVEPRLGDGVEYLGEVTHDEKVELLGGARATLFPIDWDEPFGLVMIESMACGTPVIATRRGAVPEVIEDGVTGVIVDDYREMVRALPQADALDPATIRRRAEERFTPERMVGDYLAAYERVIAESRP